MKKKAVTKKMVLNKETIAHLGESEMMAAHGGNFATTPETACSCGIIVCPGTYTEDTESNC